MNICAKLELTVRRPRFVIPFIALAGCVRTRSVLQIGTQLGKAQQAVASADGRGGGASHRKYCIYLSSFE